MNTQKEIKEVVRQLGISFPKWSQDKKHWMAKQMLGLVQSR